MLLLVIHSGKSQELRIDSTFQASGVFYPFQSVDTITGLSFSGEVTLNADTSLVRILLVTNDSSEFMIFETYPLIVDDLEFTISDTCDETCYLDEVLPNSIKVQVINAEIEINSLYYEEEVEEDLPGLQHTAKRSMDSEKIEVMNERISDYGMYWTAGDNDVVEMYYDQKKNLLGEAYNSLGFEYYDSGVFEFLGHRTYQKADADLVRKFDWRDRHGANDPSSPYWDGDTLGTGWLTSVKNQGECGSCWAFAAVGVTEAKANLFTAKHLDSDLSEQYILSCSESGNCDRGYVDTALMYIRDEGVVTEYCCEYEADDSDCSLIEICEDPDTIIRIKSKYPFEHIHDSVRIHLIEYGPSAINFFYDTTVRFHSVVLTGFEFDPKDSTIIWKFKNSWGISGNLHGFGSIKIPIIRSHSIGDTVFLNNQSLADTCRDEDNDGYYFWGLGPKPDTLGAEDVEDCDDNNPFVGGYDDNYNCDCIFEMDTVYHYISSDTTWSDTTYVNYVLIVDSGVVFTINTYVGFAPEAKIVVKRGAELVLDSAHLTKVCPELWNGIEVWGTPDSCQLKAYQGVVTVKNESIIEYADTAIFTGRNTKMDPADYYAGGIVNCESSTFRDNVYDVVFLSYKNYAPGQPQTESPNQSRFTNVDFITTANLYLYASPSAHVKMTDVYGINLKGCNFNNELEVHNEPFYARGTGIYSIDAHFFLGKYCSTPQINPCPEDSLSPCTFSKLEYGIKALNSESRRTLNIQEVEFFLNIVGLSFSGIDNASILSNVFNCRKIDKDESDDRFIGGMFLENCTGYHIENNNINPPSQLRDNDSIDGIRYGICIKDSGPYNNELYNNSIRKSNIGVISIGENRGRLSGLCLKCNDMSLNKNDFVVFEEEEPPLAVEQGIAYYQGNPNDSISSDAPAGNTFTKYISQPADSAAKLYYNYLNDAENIWYFHHQKQIYPDLTYPLDSNYTINTIQLKEWLNLVYEKDTACPSGISGGGLKSAGNPYATILEADIQIAALNAQLISLVDGGNTESLNFEVMTSLPDEGLELRSELLAESPYLSDTVLKQSIYKEDVLPNAMIRDILEANPHSAKSFEILNALDARQEPIPDYMMSQIMEGKNYLGAKELLEAKIQAWKLVRAKAKADLMRQFLLDTNQVYALDSVITFLDGEFDLQSRYDLALAYWNQKDYSNAQLTLDNIPSEFNLNPNQTSIHAVYEDYFDLLEIMKDSNWLANDLDSVHIEQLFDQLANDYGSLSAHARGMLVKGGFYDYIEKVPCPAHLKATREYTASTDKSTTENAKDYLRVFPNPAGDYAMIEYILNDQHNVGIIELSKIDGTLLRTEEIKSGTNQMILDLKDLPNGMYIVSLKSNTRNIQSKRLIKGGY
jgi:C1A family cysteine protease